MVTLLTITHILVSFFLIVIVLLQHGKGADMGASFGGSGQTVFGTDGPLPLLNKITTASAIIFMFTSVTLAYYSANTSKSSVMKSMRATAPVEQKIDTAPTPVEVPMAQGDAVKTDLGTGESPQFPGTATSTAPSAVNTDKKDTAPAESKMEPAAPEEPQKK